MSRSRRAKPTAWWVFAVHLLAVFACTVGGLIAFDRGYTWIGLACVVAWVIAFAVTALDNVCMPRLDVLRRLGKSESTEDKGVHSVQAEPTLPDLDVDRE